MTSKSTPAKGRTTTSRKASASPKSAAAKAPKPAKMVEPMVEPMVEETIVDEAALQAEVDETIAEMAGLTASDPVTVEEIAIQAQPELRKKELIDLAVERSGVKKRDAKPAIEAALAVLGEALAEGREMNVTPFGKVKVTRMKRAGHGQIINARVRQPDEPEISDDDPLAQAAE